MITRLHEFLKARLGSDIHSVEATLLTGGASQETWRIDLTLDGTAKTFCLRRAKDSETEQSLDLGGVGLTVEADLIESASLAGVKAPNIIARIQPQDDLGIGFLMDWLEGETLGHKIVRGTEFARIRPQLAEQCGKQLALIHSIDPKSFIESKRLTRMTATDFVRQTYDQYQSLGVDQPMLDFTARYLLEHAPIDHDCVLNHGDFRNGNLMIDPEVGIAAVLDWELASVTDPAKDIAWLCVNSWRFGCNELEVGGFGPLDDLLTAYNLHSGRQINRDQVHYWMVFGSFWWSVCCLSMANTYKTGVNTSLERPIIGRRASEGQLDCVNLLLPAGLEIIPEPLEQGLIPSDAELAAALQTHLKHNIAPMLEGKEKFLAQVAANAAGVLMRSAQYGSTARAQETRRLRALFDSNEQFADLNHKLCSQLRVGTFDLSNSALQAHLRATVEAQVAIDQPHYLECSQRGAR